MKSIKKGYTLFQTFALFIAICSQMFTLQAQNQPSANKLGIGDPAPLIKTSKWMKGMPVTIENGKIYVIEFWATWCAPCIAGMPHLSELAEKYKGKVTVAGISIMERGQNTLPKVERFVDSMGSRMNYNVAADENNFMRENWLQASGERGIPCAFIVDRKGRIAWIGLPKNMDPVLPGVLDNSWDIEKEIAIRAEKKRLNTIDSYDVVTKLNPFMGNPGNPVGALTEIEKILAENPGLKYYPKLGHFTFWSLIKTDPGKAVTFANEWFAACQEPMWKTVTDAVSNMMERKELPAAIYELGASSYQAQLDNYPWSMNFPRTHREMAKLYFKAGNKNKAVVMIEKAITEAKASAGFPAEELGKMQEDLKVYEKM
jgi:thiol-disulfide isomerase/thioredoxin